MEVVSDEGVKKGISVVQFFDMRGGYDKLCGVVRTLTGKMLT